MNPLHEIREAANLLLAFEQPSRLGEAADAVEALVAAVGEFHMVTNDHRPEPDSGCPGCRALAGLLNAWEPFRAPLLTMEIRA